MALYHKPKIRQRWRELCAEYVPPSAKVLQGLERLAFGSCDNLGGLLNRKLEDQQRLDLYHVSKIRYDEKGVEITFFDRQKALETLLEYSKDAEMRESGGNLLHMLEQSVIAVSGDTHET